MLPCNKNINTGELKAMNGKWHFVSGNYKVNQELYNYTLYYWSCRIANVIYY